MQIRLNSKQISTAAMMGLLSLLFIGNFAVAQVPVRPPVLPPRPAVKPPVPAAKPAPAPAAKPATPPAAKPATPPAAKPVTVPVAKPVTVPPTTVTGRPPITGRPIGGGVSTVPASTNGVAGRPTITGQTYNGRPLVGGQYLNGRPAAAGQGVAGQGIAGQGLAGQGLAGQGFNGRPPISGLQNQAGNAAQGSGFTQGGSPQGGGVAQGGGPAQGGGGSQGGSGSASGPGSGTHGSAGPGQALGSFAGCCGYTMTAYSCFRSGAQVLCDFDVTNQGNIRANAKQIYGDTHMVNGSGRVLPRTDAYFVDSDGSQFNDSQITPGSKVRMIMVFNNVPASTSSVSLAQGSNTIQSVAIANQEPGAADNTAHDAQGAGPGAGQGGGAKGKQQQ